MSAINHPALWAALQRGNSTEVAEKLFPRTAVSSAIPEVKGPQQPMPGIPALVERPAPSSPATPTARTAGVGVLSEPTMGDNGFSEFAKKDSPFRQFVADVFLPAFAPTKPQDVRSMAELHLGKAIVTTNVCPPIPCRKHDWCAYPDGEEENGDYGWGATEDEAIADLVMILQDNERIPGSP